MKRLLLCAVLMVAGSIAASAQSITYYFPQIAIGGGWMTTIFISNTMTAGTGGASINLIRSDGTPFKANWLDQMGNNVTNGGSAISVVLGPGETRKFTSVGDMPLSTGFAIVTTNASAILANAMFTQTDDSGNLLAEAGVPMAIPLMKQAIFVDTTNGFRTGVAVANPNTQPLQVHFDLVTDNGQLITSTMQNFGPQQQISLFVDELFPGLPTMVGRVQFWSTNPMTAVGLRFSAPGIPFTTLAPLAISN